MKYLTLLVSLLLISCAKGGGGGSDSSATPAGPGSTPVTAQSWYGHYWAHMNGAIYTYCITVDGTSWSCSGQNDGAYLNTYSACHTDPIALAQFILSSSGSVQLWPGPWLGYAPQPEVTTSFTITNNNYVQAANSSYFFLSQHSSTQVIATFGGSYNGCNMLFDFQAE